MTALPRRALHGARVLASLYVLAWGAWWALLSVVALRRPRVDAREPAGAWRFAVIVPAHNEERLLPTCLGSLTEAGSLLASQPEVVVVADNCTDGTAAVAERWRATVLRRDDPVRRGKGYALEYAMAELSKRAEPPDAVVFVDADSFVSRGFLRALAVRFEAGARAVQVYYEAAPDGSTLAALRRLAFMLVHWARPLGAARLGGGVGIKGNGMALRWDIGREGLGSHGLAEDAAMTLALARRGVAVAFEPGASVAGYMAPDYAAARTQDERWEQGRLALGPQALRTAAHALRTGRLDCAFAAFEVAAPPLSMLGAVASANVAADLLGGRRPRRLHIVAGWLLAAYVALGLIAARASLADVAALRLAPRFLVHKAGVLGRVVSGRAEPEWRRTARAVEA